MLAGLRGGASRASGAPTCALQPGQGFVTAGERRGTVADLLGAGGQGEVHKVLVDGVPLALKFYHPACIKADVTLRERLTRAIARGAPTQAFLWPLDFVEVPGHASFGYVMPLRPGRFIGSRDLIAAPPRRVDLPLATRAAVCLNIATCFHELHASGFCYQDINFGNIFLDPATGEVLICDNDNVDVDGAEASIYGTRKFMAPEVVRRDALPSSRTDLFSMAVLFFYVILGWHPLDGRREAETRVLDANAEKRLYGSDPLFIFDPRNPANGPVPGLHDHIVARWNSLGEPLRRLFTRSFTTGLADPRTRVLETEWRSALRAAMDAHLACATCSFEHVVEARRDRVTDPGQCRLCSAPLTAPAVLFVGRRAWTLTPGRHLEQAVFGGGTGEGAALEPHPERPELLGLRNLTGRTWSARLPDGSSHKVESGRAIRVLPGTRFDFGEVSGVVQGAEAAAR
jgi:eukaryotic-like serine/threonine-protein kinase